MASLSISLEGIDQAIVDLNYRLGSVKQKTIMAIRSFYSSDDSIKELDSINSDTLIKLIWDVGDNFSKIKSKRRNFSSLKSSINTDLKNLLKKKNKNPDNIILADSNIFDLTQEAKEDLLGSFSDAFKKGNIDLDQAATLLETMTQFLDKIDQGDKDAGSQDIVDKIKNILDQITKKNLFKNGDGTADQKVAGKGEHGEKDKGEGDLETIELDDDQESKKINENDDLEDIGENEALEEVEALNDEQLDEVESQEIGDDRSQGDGNSAKVEAITEDLEKIELDEDEEIDVGDEGDGIDGIDGIDEEDELEEIETLDDDAEQIELDEDEELEEIDESDDDIQEINPEDDKALDEIELDNDLEEVDELDNDLEEVDELDEDEELHEIDDIEDDAQEIDLEDDEKFDEIELDNDLEEVDELDDEEIKALEEFRKKRELAEQFDEALGDREKKYNRYTKVPEGLYTVGTKKGFKSTLELQQFDMPEVYIGVYPVINSLFEIFIEETGYITSAEKKGFGRVYYSKFKKKGSNGSTWNKNSGSKDVKSACWYQPTGPDSSLHGKRNHPVVQISVDDTFMFASWIGRRIPTEVEWESAARTDLGYKYPWGNEFNPKALNLEQSGLADTSSVDDYDRFANEFKIIDMLGNVMEWTSDMEIPPFKSTKNIKYCVAKGGAWNARNDATISSRILFKPGFTSNTIGFRCISEIFL